MGSESRRDRALVRRTEKHRNVHDGASQALACVRGRVNSASRKSEGGPEMLHDGTGAMQTVQGLGPVAIENVGVQTGSRKEPTAARKGGQPCQTALASGCQLEQLTIGGR